MWINLGFCGTCKFKRINESDVLRFYWFGFSVEDVFRWSFWIHDSALLCINLSARKGLNQLSTQVVFETDP